eukprot:7390333-Prymnesium_polylepis.1
MLGDVVMHDVPGCTHTEGLGTFFSAGNQKQHLKACRKRRAVEQAAAASTSKRVRPASTVHGSPYVPLSLQPQQQVDSIFVPVRLIKLKLHIVTGGRGEARVTCALEAPQMSMKRVLQAGFLGSGSPGASSSTPPTRCEPCEPHIEPTAAEEDAAARAKLRMAEALHDD